MRLGIENPLQREIIILCKLFDGNVDSFFLQNEFHSIIIERVIFSASQRGCILQININILDEKPAKFANNRVGVGKHVAASCFSCACAVVA